MASLKDNRDVKILVYESVIKNQLINALEIQREAASQRIEISIENMLSELKRQ